jgi:hypothetical protein
VLAYLLPGFLLLNSYWCAREKCVLRVVRNRPFTVRRFLPRLAPPPTTGLPSDRHSGVYAGCCKYRILRDEPPRGEPLTDQLSKDRAPRGAMDPFLARGVGPMMERQLERKKELRGERRELLLKVPLVLLMYAVRSQALTSFSIAAGRAAAASQPEQPGEDFGETGPWKPGLLPQGLCTCPCSPEREL